MPARFTTAAPTVLAALDLTRLSEECVEELAAAGALLFTREVPAAGRWVAPPIVQDPYQDPDDAPGPPLLRLVS